MFSTLLYDARLIAIKIFNRNAALQILPTVMMCYLSWSDKNVL